jgi:hypothetical protein
LTGAPPVLVCETCVGTGAPGGIQGVTPSESGGGTVPPGVQYDLITDLLDFPMTTVATLGVLIVESFCESVLSSVQLVVADLHVSLKPSEIRMLVMIRMNH